jgi:hypothetical protein
MVVFYPYSHIENFATFVYTIHMYHGVYVDDITDAQ